MLIADVHYGCGLLILLSIDIVILHVAFDVVSLHSCFYRRFVIVVVLGVILLLIAIIAFYVGFIVTFIVGFHVFLVDALYYWLYLRFSWHKGQGTLNTRDPPGGMREAMK